MPTIKRLALRHATAYFLLTLAWGGTISVSRADTMLGNDPDANDNAQFYQGGDGIAALTLFTGQNFAIPTGGLISTATINEGNSGAFALYLLDPIASDADSTTYEVLDRYTNTVASPAPGDTTYTLNWEAAPNDLLAYWGYVAGYVSPGNSSGTFVTTPGSNSAPEPGDADSEFTVYTSPPPPGASYATDGYRDYSVEFDFVPEPGSMAMLTIGGLVLLGLRRLWLRNA